jgi:AcrR family transcriptional regulator
VQRFDEGFRIRQVAAEAGIDNGTLHFHFPTKEALIHVVVDYLTEDLKNNRAAWKDAEPSALDELRMEFEDIRLVVGALAGGVALAVMYGVHSIPGQLAAAGAVCYALVIIIGVPTCVRINHQIESWAIQNPPPGWAQVRARWLRFHVIRTLFSVPAFAVYVLAAMSNCSNCT